METQNKEAMKELDFQREQVRIYSDETAHYQRTVIKLTRDLEVTGRVHEENEVLRKTIKDQEKTLKQ
jgi:hypothetical protein